MAFDVTKAAGEGMQDIDSSVLGAPFISIIQKGSPEFDETHKDYATKMIKDCKPGQIVFAPDRRILAAPLEVIPLGQRTLYTEWKPRKGGFVGNRELTIVDHPSYHRGAPGSKEENKEWLGENELVRTITVAVLFRDKNEWKKGLIAFKSTELKSARTWSKALKNLRFKDYPDIEAPIYAGVWNMATKADSNELGGWFGWDIKLAKVLDPAADEALLTLGQSTRIEAERTMLPSTVGQKALTAGGAEQADAKIVGEDAPY